MAFCPQCGYELMENDRFCNNCGNPVPNRQHAKISGNEDSCEIIESSKNGAATIKKGVSVAFLIVSIIMTQLWYKVITCRATNTV